MTIDTAIKLLKAEYEKAKLLKFVNNPTAYALYQTWKRVDGHDEKQTPKKPLDIPLEAWPHCPSCGGKLDDRENKNYCADCGQKLDWSDDE